MKSKDFDRINAEADAQEKEHRKSQDKVDWNDPAARSDERTHRRERHIRAVTNFICPECGEEKRDSVRWVVTDELCVCRSCFQRGTSKGRRAIDQASFPCDHEYVREAFIRVALDETVALRRVERGLSLTDLCRATDLSIAQVHRAMKGTPIPLTHAIALLEALGLIGSADGIWSVTSRFGST